MRCVDGEPPAPDRTGTVCAGVRGQYRAIAGAAHAPWAMMSIALEMIEGGLSMMCRRRIPSAATIRVDGRPSRRIGRSHQRHEQAMPPGQTGLVGAKRSITSMDKPRGL